VCQGDYSGALRDIGALVFKNISPCLEGSIDLRDLDPDNPGLQPDCTVTDVATPDGDTEVEASIPQCHMLGDEQPELGSASACWWVKSNPGTCATQTGLELHVERAVLPAPNTKVRVNCALDAV